MKKLSIYSNIFQFFSDQSDTNLSELEYVIFAHTLRKEIVKLCEEYISKHPFDSEKLQSPLNECRSFHFKLNNVHYRIAYRIVENEERIDIVLVGTRENFYQRLRSVLK